jgi:hypothetical protein
MTLDKERKRNLPFSGSNWPPFSMTLRKADVWRLNVPSGSAFILPISVNWVRSFAVDMIALAFSEEGLDDVKAATWARVLIKRWDVNDDTEVW